MKTKAPADTWLRLGILIAQIAAKQTRVEGEILVEGRESNAPAFAATKPRPQEEEVAAPHRSADAQVDELAARCPAKKGSGSKSGGPLGTAPRGAKAMGSRPGDTRTTVVRGADENEAARRRGVWPVRMAIQADAGKIEIEMSGLDPRRPGHTAAGLQCGIARPAADLHSAFHNRDVR